jgi:tRNA (guanine37-N1)-methyltransferase
MSDPAVRFEIVTIFPEFFGSTLQFGVVARALRAGIADLRTVDLRSFTHDRHRTVDDRPFGGGEGMVLKPEPLAEAIESLGHAAKAERDPRRETVILLSAQGRPLTQTLVQELAGVERIVMICGRYEGVDERVNELLCDREISVGDYVLSGGELGAAIIVDAVTRLLPGVLGNADSAHYESFGHAHDTPQVEGAAPLAVSASAGLLDYPHYTRPAEFRGVAVPEVLSGGDHLAIRRWRREQALRKTFLNRPDLLVNAALSKEDRRFLKTLEAASEQGE